MNYANSTRKAIGQAKPKVGDLLADWNVPVPDSPGTSA